MTCFLPRMTSLASSLISGAVTQPTAGQPHSMPTQCRGRHRLGRAVSVTPRTGAHLCLLLLRVHVTGMSLSHTCFCHQGLSDKTKPASSCPLSQVAALSHRLSVYSAYNPSVPMPCVLKIVYLSPNGTDELGLKCTLSQGCRVVTDLKQRREGLGPTPLRRGQPWFSVRSL